MSMNTVGIDVSKWKSTVAILRPGGKVIVKLFDVPHTLVRCFPIPYKKPIRKLDGETTLSWSAPAVTMNR